MLQAVQPGDTVMDVGMNVGHVSVLAAGIVGTEGRVISFEPNIALATLVQEHLSCESIQNVTILPYALGAAPGRFPLRLDPHHSGGATLRSGADMSHEVQCDVAIGDEVMASQTTPGKLFLKLDVEGFEVEALLGLRATLTRVAHAVVEVSPEWLGKDGVEKLFWLMRQAGLFPFVLLESGKPAGPLQARDISTQVNVLFLRSTAG